MQTNEANHHDSNQAPALEPSDVSTSKKTKKVKSKASLEASLPRGQSDQYLSSKKKKRNTSMKRSKSFSAQPAYHLTEVQSPFCVENMGLSQNMLERKSKSLRSSRTINSSFSSNMLERKSESLRSSRTINSSFSSTISTEKSDSLRSTRSNSQRSSRSSTKSKKTKSKSSKESSLTRQKSEQSVLKTKKKRNEGVMKRSKSMGEVMKQSKSMGEQPAASSEAASVLARQMLAPKSPRRSTSNKSKKAKAQPSKVSFVTSDDGSERKGRTVMVVKELALTEKRNGTGVQRSKSFGDSLSKQKQRSSSSKKGVKRSKSFGEKGKSLTQSTGRKISKPKKAAILHAKSKDENGPSLMELLGEELAPTITEKQNGTGAQRSKSFGDSLSKQKQRSSSSKKGVKRSKSFGEKGKSLTQSTESQISKPKKAAILQTKTNDENGPSLMELLLTGLTPPNTDKPESAEKNKADRKVHFADKIRFKKIKHSKIEPELIWYSEQEISELCKRGQEVIREARACNNATILNLEGLLTIQECNTMFERQIESRNAVFEVQDSHRRLQEEQAATAIFRGGKYMESLSYCFDLDEAIAEEYELFTLTASQCAQERAIQLAMHVNLLWDESADLVGNRAAGWQGKKFAESQIAPMYHTMMAQ